MTRALRIFGGDTPRHHPLALELAKRCQLVGLDAKPAVRAGMGVPCMRVALQFIPKPQQCGFLLQPGRYAWPGLQQCLVGKTHHRRRVAPISHRETRRHQPADQRALWRGDGKTVQQRVASRGRSVLADARQLAHDPPKHRVGIRSAGTDQSFGDVDQRATQSTFFPA